MEAPDRIKFPDKLVTYFDLVKGVGEIMLHAAFDSIHHEAHVSDSTHEITDAVTTELPTCPDIPHRSKGW